MSSVLNFLRGKRTFIMAACLFVTYGAEGMGWISADIATFLKGLFAAGSVASMRLAIK